MEAAKKRQKANRETRRESRIEKLRAGLTPLQKTLVNELWQHYRATGKWSLARAVHSKHDKKAVKDQLSKYEVTAISQNRGSDGGLFYQLTPIGVLLTRDGPRYWELLVHYLEFLRKEYKREPEKMHFKDQEFKEALKLSDEQTQLLGELLKMSHLLSSGGSNSQNSWSIGVPEVVEDSFEKPPEEALADLLLDAIKPAQTATGYGADRYWPSGGGFGGSIESPVRAQHSVDALKRRYTVFVSSPYEDLKSERQHVIQALLESKCMPIGMELFPAASTQQWELIKRVIRECDYYIVVIAGRYGSLNESGVGYTEAEFDYALSIEKPVIGFYHENPLSLTGDKLERSDAGRARLAAFTEKIKNRLCRSWSSPHELGSAVKSAIFNALEYDPRPGWIRGDAVPSSEIVDKLKQRIADLEEKLKKQKTANGPSFAAGTEQVVIPLKIEFDFEAPEPEFGILIPRQQLGYNYETTWDDLVLILGADLQAGANTRQLKTTLDSYIEPRLPELVGPMTGGLNFRFESSDEKLDVVLKTLIARKLVKMGVGTYGTWSDPSYRFTPKGLQYSAELQAVRSGA